MVSKNIELDSSAQMSAIFGPCDINIKTIEKTLDVAVMCRDMVMTVAGEEQAVKRASGTIETLKKMFDSGQPVNELTIGQAMELVEDGSADDAVTVMKDVLTITFKGKPVKCKTIGQKKLYKGNRRKYGNNLYRSCRYRQDISGDCHGCGGTEKRRNFKNYPDASGSRSGRASRFSSGDLQSKVDPYLRQLYDALFEMLGEERFNRCLERGIIEVAPLAYMRGRTLSNSIIILDESQNAQLGTAVYGADTSR